MTADGSGSGTTDPTAGSDTMVAGECGNGMVEGAEECDDSNTDPNDGCSGACLDEDVFCDPRLVGGFNQATSFTIGRMVADGGYLYYVRPPSTTPSTLSVLDVATPAAITAEGELQLDPGNFPNWFTLGIVKTGDHVWIGGGEPEWLSVDVSMPSSPVEDFVGGPNASDGHIALEGNLLVRARGVSETAELESISDPSNPADVAVYGNPGEVFTNVGITTDYAAALTRNRHLEIWDISVPAMPIFEGQLDIGSPMFAPNNRVLVDSDSIFIMTNETGVIIVDWALASVPELAAGSIDIGEPLLDGALRGDFLYLPVQSGLQVYDVANHDDPELAGTYLQIDAFANAVALDDQYVYLSTDNGLRVLADMPGFCEAKCGNTTVEYPEDCDDGNNLDGDGCPANCEDVGG